MGYFFESDVRSNGARKPFSVILSNSRSSRQIRLSWQHSIVLYQHWRGGGLQITQSQHCLRQTERPGLGAPGPEARNQTESLQGSCYSIPALCKRDMDCLQLACQTTQRLPHEMSEDPASHQVAGQSTRHWSPPACWVWEHPCHSAALSALVGRPCSTNGQQLTPKKTALWWTYSRTALTRPAKKAIQRQRISQVLWHNPYSTWEASANDRPAWHSLVSTGVLAFEANRIHEKIRFAREERERSSNPQTGPAPSIPCPHCNRHFRAKIGLFSHPRTHSTSQWYEVMVFFASEGRTSSSSSISQFDGLSSSKCGRKPTTCTLE